MEGRRVVAEPAAGTPDVLGLVASLLERLRDPAIGELEVREGGVRAKVSKAATDAPSHPTEAPPEPRPAAEPAPRPAQQKAKASEVTAPLTGIFYRSPSPQASPFVQQGSVVAAGDVVGLIEAMKLFNEVRSSVSGRIRRVVAENGQLVRAHQPLFELE